MKSLLFVLIGLAGCGLAPPQPPQVRFYGAKWVDKTISGPEFALVCHNGLIAGDVLLIASDWYGKATVIGGSPPFTFRLQEEQAFDDEYSAAAWVEQNSKKSETCKEMP